MNVAVDKQAIINSFSQQASVYEKFAYVQQRNAEQLASFVRRDIDTFVDGPVLEIGCGTGIFTRQILQLFHQRDLFISDISSAMLQHCAENLGEKSGTPDLKFIQLDAEAVDLDVKFAVIIASFSLQWVSNFEQTIAKLLDQLLPGGQLIVAVPTDDSFKEWREQCDKSLVPFTANRLPNHSDFVKYTSESELSVEWMLTDIECKFNSSMSFFKSMKGVGASVTTSGQSLSGTQLRKLTREWDKESSGRVSITYSVLSARISKGASA